MMNAFKRPVLCAISKLKPGNGVDATQAIVFVGQAAHLAGALLKFLKGSFDCIGGAQ